MPDAPSISAIVLNRNGGTQLQRLLGGLVRSTDYPNLELIVVDNGSTDGSLEALRAFEAQHPLAIVANTRNRSPSDVRNQGAERARGELLLFLDNGIELIESGWLSELVACWRESACGAVSATLLCPAAESDRGLERGYRVYHRGFAFRGEEGWTIPVPRDSHDETLDEALGVDIACDAVSASCLLIERAAFGEVGGFSPGYRFEFEDVDLCLKLRAAGMRVICSGRSIALQRPGAAPPTTAPERPRKERLADRRRLWRRWGPLLHCPELSTRSIPLIQRLDARLHVTLKHLIALQMLKEPDVFFVQIGAFDGKTGDQIYPYATRYDWRGIAVEPQPRYFSRLEEAYAEHHGVELRNVAIAEKRGERTLYAIDPEVPDLPSWTGGIASFDRSHLERADVRGPNGEEVIEELSVDCITVDELLSGVERVDLLQVDAEGFDGEIIRLFPFHAYRPSIVRFESFSLDQSDHNNAVGRLVEHGYKLALTGVDTIAWHEEG